MHHPGHLRRLAALLLVLALAAAACGSGDDDADQQSTEQDSTEQDPTEDDSAADAVDAPAEETGAPSMLAPLEVYGRHWIELAPILVAAESFYPEPLTVNDGTLRAMVAGDADLATNAETQLLRLSVDDPELRIIMTVTESVYRIVARGSAGIETLADLEGKRVMLPSNTSAHYFVVDMLRTVGLTEDDIEIVGLPEGTSYLTGMDQMSTALADGEVDAIAMWEPEPQDAIDVLGDDAVVFQDDGVYREVFNLHARESTLSDPDKRQAIVEFVRATIQASDAFRANPEEHWPYVSNTTGFTVAEIEGVWDEMRFPGEIVPDMLDVLEEEEAWFAAVDEREPRTRDELAELIDPSIMEEALASG